MKKIPSGLLLFSVLSTGCTIKYLDAPSGFAKQAPPSTSLRYPVFPKSGPERGSITSYIKAVHKNMKAFKESKEIDNYICSNSNNVTGLQKRFDKMEIFAKKTSAVLSPLMHSTLRNNQNKFNSFSKFKSLADKSLKAEATNSRTGYKWLFTEAIVNAYCSASKKELYGIAAGAVHWATSTEAVYKSYFETMEKLKMDKNNFNYFWFAQSNGISKATATLNGLILQKSSAAGKGTPSANVKVSVTAGGLPLKCKEQASIIAPISPGLEEAGTHVNLDSQFWVGISCENTSNEKMLISESLVQAGKPNACFADASKEHVMAEIPPNGKTTVTLGPYLLSERCKGSFSHQYKIASSDYGSGGRINFQFTPRSPSFKLDISKVDKDLAGHSKVDKSKKLGKNDAAELRISARADKDYRVVLSKFEPMLSSAPSPFKEIKDARGSLMYVPSTNRHVYENDIDLVMKKSNAWKNVLRHRVNAAKKNDWTVEADPDNMWLRTKAFYLSSCKSSAKYLPSPLDILYGSVCEKDGDQEGYTYKEFSTWMENLYKDACKSDNMKSKIANKLKKPGIQDALKSKIDKAKSASAAPQVGSSEKFTFINPGYADAIVAVHKLLDYGIITEEELKLSLEHIDNLFFNKAGSRETSRQLLLAAAMAEAVEDILGREEVAKIPIYSNGSAISILQLEEYMLRLQIQKNLTKGSKIPKPTSVKSLVQEAVNYMKAEGSCKGKAPIPPKPPREVRSATRFITISLDLKE